MKKSKQTLLVNDQHYSKGAVAPPIYQSSLFSFETYEQLESFYNGDIKHAIYSRVDNPTVEMFEEKMALLEGAQAGAAYASGIAAISNVILSLVEKGDKVLAVENVYPDTYRLLKDICHKFGIETEFVDGSDLDQIEKSIIGKKFIYLESPSTSVMGEQNLAAIAALAKKNNVVSIIDNSWASPIFQNPIEHGIDIVVHSASKYISGHSDVVAGIAVGKKDIINKIKTETSAYLGAKLSAHEASLLLRSLRTLPLRLKQHEENGLFIAEKLKTHDAVTKVNHPGLARLSYSALKGYGSLMSLEVAENVNIPNFCNALELFRLGVSWGGYESLIMPAIAAINKGGYLNSAVDFGVPKNLIRIFVGLEQKEDLWLDIDNAFKKAIG